MKKLIIYILFIGITLNAQQKSAAQQAQQAQPSPEQIARVKDMQDTILKKSFYETQKTLLNTLSTTITSLDIFKPYETNAALAAELKELKDFFTTEIKKRLDTIEKKIVEQEADIKAKTTAAEQTAMKEAEKKTEATSAKVIAEAKKTETQQVAAAKETAKTSDAASKEAVKDAHAASVAVVQSANQAQTALATPTAPTTPAKK